MSLTSGNAPTTPNGASAQMGYAPGYGPVPVQLGTPTGDTTQGANNQLSAPQVVTQAAPFNIAASGLPVLPAIVQKAGGKSTGSVASLAQAFASANVAGNSIVVVCAIGNGTDPTIADTLGNTYTKALTGANSTTFEVSIWFAVNILGGANTVTVTNAGATASMAVEVYEVSGLIAQATVQPGQMISATGTSGTASTSAISASAPNQLAFAGVAVGTAAQTITPATGWTNDSGQQNPTTPAGLFSFVSMSQYMGTLGAVTPQATFTSEPWAIAAASFRPVVLGIEGTVRIAGYNYTNITTQTTTLIKGGAGVLHAIIINKPLASGVIELDDAVTHTTPVIGTITLPATLLQDGPKVGTYDIAFSTGLSITTSGATQDITVVWK